MNKDIDITKIGIRRLIKLCIKDHDRGIENWNEPLLVRGLQAVSTYRLRRILLTDMQNRALSRACARARTENRLLQVFVGGWQAPYNITLTNVTVSEHLHSRITFLESEKARLDSEHSDLVMESLKLAKQHCILRNSSKYYGKSV